MKPVKWCPHCQSPNGADELQCLKCGYAFRVRITVEPDEPLNTFHPKSHPPQRRGISFPWKRIVVIFTTLAALVVVAILGSVVFYFFTPEELKRTPHITRTPSGFAGTPRFPDTDRRMPVDNQSLSLYNEKPEVGDSIVRHDPAPMTNWLGIQKGLSQEEVFNLCGLPNAKAVMQNSVIWLYQNADNSLTVEFKNDIAADVLLDIRH